MPDRRPRNSTASRRGPSRGRLRSQINSAAPRRVCTQGHDAESSTSHYCMYGHPITTIRQQTGRQSSPNVSCQETNRARSNIASLLIQSAPLIGWAYLAAFTEEEYSASIRAPVTLGIVGRRIIRPREEPQRLALVVFFRPQNMLISNERVPP